MPKCPVCDTWMKKTKTRETMPVKGGIATFDVECWKCPKCGEEIYDEKQYSQVARQVQSIVRPMSESLVKKAQKISIELELHFMKLKEREQLIARS